MKKTNLIIAMGSIVGGILGALSGSDNSSKIFRRFLLPCILTSMAYWQSESILILSLMLMSVAFSMGYGIPSYDDPRPSKLGYLFYNLFKGNILLSNIFTRGTLALIVNLSLLSIPILKQNWIEYIIGSIIILFIYSFISWKDLGTYKFFKWRLLWSETILYFIITIVSLILIK